MFENFINIIKQFRKIFNIKVILNKTHSNLENENKSLEEQQLLWLDLKKRIFECGSLYVKFLQWYISKLKSNILDNENTVYTKNLLVFVSYFEDIFENCPFHSLEATKEIFSSENGMNGIKLEEYVAMDTLQELASGSIGQVYVARRLSDGCMVAIKVKHPDIAQNLKEQISFIKMLSYIQTFNWIRRRYNLIFNIDDFLTDINQQCDFNNEANNNIKLKENFKDSSDFLIFPEVYFQSKDVLISQYIPGKEFTSLSPVEQNMTALNFVCFFYQMLLVDNFIHGDLHCKNWKVYIHNENDELPKVKIVIYDTGICFSNSDIELSRDFWFAIGKYDMKVLNTTLKKFIIKGTSGNNSITEEELSLEIENMFSIILANSLGTGMFLKTIIKYCSNRNILIDKFLLNISITICLLEEFLRKTDMINRERNINNSIAMYDIIDENILDIIAFCKVKKCYPRVLELFEKELNNKYIAYQVNLLENNIQETGKNNTAPILFNSLALSGLVMREPGSFASDEIES